MNNKPFFSITIPTFNRANSLKTAIKSVLLQDFEDFEIVITDNSTNNESKIICQSFRDKRIRYSQNTENIGAIRNIYKVIKSAWGKYVFILGDDDCILRKNTLSDLYETINAKGYGYVRLKFVFHRNFQVLFDFNLYDGIGKILKKNSSNGETLEFIQRSNSAQISGLIFKNYKQIYISEIEKTQDPNFTMEVFWLSFIYKQAKKYGAFIDEKHPIIGKWSSACASKTGPSLYAVVNNRLYVEKGWELFFKDLNEEEKIKWTKDQMEKTIPLLPSVKYHSDTKNLLLFIKRMLHLNKELYYKPTLYFYALVSILMPRFLWDLIRNTVQNRNIVVHDEMNDDLISLNKYIC